MTTEILDIVDFACPLIYFFSLFLCRIFIIYIIPALLYFPSVPSSPLFFSLLFSPFDFPQLLSEYLCSSHLLSPPLLSPPLLSSPLLSPPLLFTHLVSSGSILFYAILHYSHFLLQPVREMDDIKRGLLCLLFGGTVHDVQVRYVEIFYDISYQENLTIST